ncbi:uncharacterized protein [Antedon mediterranea]|uniref:uncharacterized protein n=1 Tax=Antedon mediterranea TaxID=105859 RepID=UPI003AF96F5E
MRFCEGELLELAKLPPDLDGVLQFKPQASRIRDQIQGYKSRWFKLKGNFLFYYRINDEGKVRELLGAFLMERFRILLEVKPNFAFSIAFQNDRERKYIFVTNSNAECQRWSAALRNASYEKLQTQFFLLQQKLIRITGKNPVQRHGLQRYYVDFLSEDGIEINDDDKTDEIKPKIELTTNCDKETKHDQTKSKEIKNKRHPLASIQEHRFQQEQGNDNEKQCKLEKQSDSVKNKTETSHNGAANSVCKKDEENCLAFEKKDKANIQRVSLKKGEMNAKEEGGNHIVCENNEESDIVCEEKEKNCIACEEDVNNSVSCGVDKADCVQQGEEKQNNTTNQCEQTFKETNKDFEVDIQKVEELINNETLTSYF